MRPEMLQSFTADDFTSKKKTRTLSKARDIRLRNVPPEKPFPKKKRNLSKAARARISQAQKARWAKVKNGMKFEFNHDKREWKDVTPGKAIGEKVSAAFAKLIPEMSGKTALQDKVNHPVHYGGDVPHEVWKCLNAWGLEADSLLWNAVKYISRAYKKNQFLEDLKKAQWYLNKRIELQEKVQR